MKIVVEITSSWVNVSKEKFHPAIVLDGETWYWPNIIQSSGREAKQWAETTTSTALYSDHFVSHLRSWNIERYQWRQP